MTGDRPSQEPKRQTFEESVGSVGNQGTQNAVAGTVGGNQIGKVETQQNISVSGDYREINLHDQSTYFENYYQAPPSPPTGVPNNLPLLNASTFVGRDAELTQLHQQLQANERVAISAIAGMGGVGKTELALRYAYLQAKSYPAGLCWLQVRGAEVGAQVVSFGRGELGLILPDGLDLAEQVAFCWNRWRPEGDALIVVDDVADYPSIEPYLPSDSRFKLLLTSRLNLGSSFQVLDLNVLEPEPALDLLRSLATPAHINSELDAAIALCEWLGYLPLGLELAGRYLHNKPDLSIAELQERLNEKRLAAQALCRTEAGMTAQLGVAAAFELSWQELSEPAQQLGCLLALFAQAPIPWKLVEQAGKPLSNELVDAEALEELRDEELGKRHLLPRKEKGVYQLHPLLREFLALKAGKREDNEALVQAICQAVVSVAKTVPQKPTLEQIAEIEPNLSHLEEVATTLRSELSDEDLPWPFTALGEFWSGQGAYAQAEPWFKQCLQVAREQLGEDHPNTATGLNNLANLYREQGRYREAEPLLAQALEISHRVLGEDHPETATSLNNLAALYRDQGRYGEAEPLLAQALEISHRVLGEDHPNTATSLNNLANLYRDQGRYREAEPLLAQALEIRCRALGEDHPNTATSLNNLAVLYRDQGRYGEAEPLLAQALEINRRVLGEGHPDTATSLNNLAGLYYAQGRYEDAEPLLAQALEICRRALGEDHPSTAQSLNNLAGLYDSQGRYEEAEPLYSQALEIRRRLLGEDHPETAQSLNNLAGLYYARGRYEDAEPLLAQALEITRRVLGEDYPDKASSLSSLAFLYDSRGRDEDAEPFYSQVLEISRRLLGEDYPDTTTSPNNLAELYRDQGRDEDAEPFYSQVLEISRRLLGEDYPDTTTSPNNLAELYRDQGRDEDAEPFYSQVLEISRRLLGEDHPSTAQSLNNLAFLYQSQGRYGEAEPLYLQALEIRRRILGEDHPETVKVRESLENLRRDYGKVESLYNLAIKISRALGDDHPHAANSLNNLAEFYRDQGRYGEAESLYTQALEILEKRLGPEHPNTVTVRENLEALRRELGR